MKKVYLGLHLLLMFYAVGGIFSKRASGAPFLSGEYIQNYLIVLGILAVYAVFWQIILKKLPLTVAMANKSVTIVWGIVYGWLFFEEKITLMNVIGAAVIIAGIVVVVNADKEQDGCM